MIDYRLVYVQWVDSYGVSSSWKSLDDAKDERHIIHSVGWLVKDGENVKVIVPHISPANDKISSDEYGCGDMSIPVSAIVSMYDIDVAMLQNLKTASLAAVKIETDSLPE